MGETCPICERISVTTCTGIPGTTIDKVCFRVKAGADTTCYQVGYERSQHALAAANARAEKAEAAFAEFRMLNPARADLIEALAAARRECDVLRTHLERMIAWADLHVHEVESIAGASQDPKDIRRARAARAEYDFARVALATGGEGK